MLGARCGAVPCRMAGRAGQDSSWHGRVEWSTGICMICIGIVIGICIGIGIGTNKYRTA